MVPESQFANVKTQRRRKSRKLRKNYDVVVLATRASEGRYKKGEGLRRGVRHRRRPIMGDALIHSETTIWLRA